MFTLSNRCRTDQTSICYLVIFITRNNSLGVGIATGANNCAWCAGSSGSCLGILSASSAGVRSIRSNVISWLWRKGCACTTWLGPRTLTRHCVIYTFKDVVMLTMVALFIPSHMVTVFSASDNTRTGVRPGSVGWWGWGWGWPVWSSGWSSWICRLAVRLTASPLWAGTTVYIVICGKSSQ